MDNTEELIVFDQVRSLVSMYTSLLLAVMETNESIVKVGDISWIWPAPVVSTSPLANTMLTAEKA